MKIDNLTTKERKNYFKDNFLTLSTKIQTKIFLYKMRFLYPELNLKIFYSPLIDLSSGIFGQSQLFTIGSDLYYYSPSPFHYKFRKVFGIYNIDKDTFMILRTQSGYYQLFKNSFTLSIVFLSFKDAKNYMELNYV